MRNSRRNVLCGVAWSVWIGAALASCSGDERERLAQVTQACFLPSDCDQGLVCLFQTCHVICEKDVDCLVRGEDARCVRALGFNACQEADERSCKNDWDCWNGQTCAVDGKCHDACAPEQACIAGLQCSTGGECARKVELGPGGMLLPAAGAGTGGASGDAGSPGTGGTGTGTEGGAGTGGEPTSSGGAQAGGSSSIAGGNATGGDAAAGESSNGGNASEGGSSAGGAGATGPSGAAGDGGASSGGIVYDYVETDDGEEVVANDDYDHPIPISKRVKTYLAGPDEDWFAITPPQDGLAHIISLRIEPDTALSTQLKVVSQTDFSPIDSATFTAGVTSFAYVTAAPNTTILFGFVRYPISGSQGFADISFDVVAENDAYEPNNTKTQAAKIELGVTITGQILNPYGSQIDRPREDWYAIDLQPGTATVQILDTPDQGAFTMHRMTPNGASASIGSAPVGGTATLDPFNVAEAGTYLLQVVPNTSNANTRLLPFSVGAKPAYLDQQYSFVVTQ